MKITIRYIFALAVTLNPFQALIAGGTWEGTECSGGTGSSNCLYTSPDQACVDSIAAYDVDYKVMRSPPFDPNGIVAVRYDNSIVYGPMPSWCGTKFCGYCKGIQTIYEGVGTKYFRSYELPWGGWNFAIVKRCGDGTQMDPRVTDSLSCPPVHVVHNTNDQKCTPEYGNPIRPLTGAKTQLINLGLRVGGIELSIRYNTSRHGYNQPYQSDPTNHYAKDIVGEFGEYWWLNVGGRLYHSPLTSNFATAANVSIAGDLVGFKGQIGLQHTPATPGISGRLQDLAGYKYVYIDPISGVMTLFDGSGLPISRIASNGSGLHYTISTLSTPVSIAPGANYIIGVNDDFGRSVFLSYALVNNRPVVVRMVDQSGRVTSIDYDAQANPVTIYYPDGTFLGLKYEDSSNKWALTSMVDEAGMISAEYGYDADGNAIATNSKAGNYSVAFNTPPVLSVREVLDPLSQYWVHYVEWSAPTGVKVTDGRGNVTELGATVNAGHNDLASRSQPAGSGCEASSSSLDYDTNGNVASRVDFAGKRTCLAYDLGRNLETARVDGLRGTDACPADVGAYVVPAGLASDRPQRKVTTQWHPLWRLEARRAEPGRITTTVYNGQPDPLNGNAVAACAPAGALLPNGSPIAVVCKRYEQATTDATGSQGFAALPQAGVPVRTEAYTYNLFGQVLTAKGARTDVNDTTTYVYYADTTADHTMGDLQSVTNPVGQTTTYNQYNAHGQLLQSTDANGVVTVNTYDLRMRLTSTSVAGELTQYGYDPVGQLKTLTLPNGTVMSYTYDGAHRLTDITDAAGNNVHYTLDVMGNRTNETVSTASGNFARNINRAYDALNRLQSVQLAGMPVH